MNIQTDYTNPTWREFQRLLLTEARMTEDIEVWTNAGYSATARSLKRQRTFVSIRRRIMKVAINEHKKTASGATLTA
ncbi:hypothetical protein [Mangrovibacillus cuniculi]|uniref:Uncharacterized protein n=1 Tax=Mangrovibacillus cuniculi TaxID=2593652 RepID=A0A7S8CEH9_9BACI|nr:hypothetical protein [Mangrovibacillus cuniculi]QPC47137.1 hypothetical protein G8O30_09240 [Mangrovibacillus cuniculi]QPC48512.1 hypothetical protein G8O30_16025 [Mangrovibacillus cuniculi]